MIKKPTRLPDKEEIAELVAYLPRLYAPGFNPIKGWAGSTNTKSGVWRSSYPEYDALVEDFIKAASQECWCDHDYSPPEASRMLRDEDLVRHSTLAQIKTMLTFCVRGERFCDGHLARVIAEGHIRRLLERLVELRSEISNRPYI